MPINILMPALSPTMEKGNLAKWLKKPGDKIKSGDVIAEIETDKATMEVEAVDEGTLALIIVADGTQDVSVNAVIGVIALEGEDVASVKPTSAPANVSAAPTAPAAAPTAPAATPAAAAAPVSSPATAPAGARVLASPLAKRVAKDLGLDLAKISGSGPRGRVILSDVEKAKSAPKAAPETKAASAAAPMATGASDDSIRKLFAAGSFTETPHDGMRKTIARRLMESKQTVPHFYLTVECELDKLLKLREEINAAAPQRDGKPAYKVSVNDFVIKALALALQKVPEANVTWTENAMLKHKSSDVGVAVSIPGGLITPVVRNAEFKSLSQISNEMKDMAARAKARKLKPEEYQGGTTAVSNLGMFGIKEFSAIINPPHASILAVGAGEQRAIVKGGAIVPATVMSATLSTDHRAIDGALGAEFISAFKALIENPLGMLV